VQQGVTKTLKTKNFQNKAAVGVGFTPRCAQSHIVRSIALQSISFFYVQTQVRSILALGAETLVRSIASTDSSFSPFCSLSPDFQKCLIFF
jgi:hypothetical protein